jgi:hypothetical protein
VQSSVPDHIRWCKPSQRGIVFSCVFRVSTDAIVFEFTAKLVRHCKICPGPESVRVMDKRAVAQLSSPASNRVISEKLLLCTERIADPHAGAPEPPRTTAPGTTTIEVLDSLNSTSAPWTRRHARPSDGHAAVVRPETLSSGDNYDSNGQNTFGRYLLEEIANTHSCTALSNEPSTREA